MATANPNLLGQIAIREGYLKPKQLEDCLFQQHLAGKPTPLGELLIWGKYVTPEQLDELLHLQAAYFKKVAVDSQHSGLLGQMAVDLGYLSREHLHDALREQQETPDKQGLGHLLLRKGFINAEQLLDLLRQQKRVIVKCPGCEIFYDMTSLDEGGQVLCSECGKSVTSPPRNP